MKAPGKERRRGPGVGLRISLDVRPLQVSTRYQGIGVYCHNLVTALAALEGEEEYLLVQRADAPLEGLPSGPRVKAFPVRRAYDHDARFLSFLDQALLPLDLLRARTRLHHAFSIHYLCARLPCASVVTIHDMIPFVFPRQYMRSGIKHRLLFRFARRADHVLVPSEHTRRDVHRYLGIPLERITVTPEAADERFRPCGDPGRLEEVRRKYRIPGPYLLYVGGFTQVDPRKNVDRLIEVYGELRREGPAELHLVLAGKKGAYSRRLLQEMGREEPPEGVHFTDYVDPEDLPALYAGAACFVFPSSYEGFGLPLLEALACGTPSIAYRHASIPEVAGDAALLLDEEAGPSALLEAIRGLLTNREMAGRLREAGPRQARRFSWEETARRTLAVYRRVCGVPVDGSA